MYQVKDAVHDRQSFDFQSALHAFPTFGFGPMCELPEKAKLCDAHGNALNSFRIEEAIRLAIHSISIHATCDRIDGIDG